MVFAQGQAHNDWYDQSVWQWVDGMACAVGEVGRWHDVQLGMWCVQAREDETIHISMLHSDTRVNKHHYHNGTHVHQRTMISRGSVRQYEAAGQVAAVSGQVTAVSKQKIHATGHSDTRTSA
jgi:hypothetical protein